MSSESSVTHSAQATQIFSSRIPSSFPMTMFLHAPLRHHDLFPPLIFFLLQALLTLYHIIMKSAGSFTASTRASVSLANANGLATAAGK